jgi:hypothetical protein
MGSHFSAPVKVRSERSTRGILALFLVIGVLAAITITGSGIASAGALGGSGGGFFGPRIIDGGVDVNGDGEISITDDSTNFFGATDIVDGLLDCDNWGATINAGLGGDDGTDDDCKLRGFFAQAAEDDSDDYYIWVEDGEFLYYSIGSTAVTTDRFFIPDGWRLPGRYLNTSSLDSTDDFQDDDWAWRFENGRFDYDFDDNPADDSPQNFLGTIDIELGYVDIDESGVGNETDGTDSCANGCFWGFNVTNGVVQSTGTAFVATTGPAGPQGLAGTNGVSGRIAISDSSSTNSLNKSKSATCSGTTKVLGGGYSLTGTTETLKHLTVVANGPAGGTAWRVRVIEATPTAGTWAVTVTAICATA